ncbi:hypothetical protein B0T21DRAFT_170872 [Apiosordaria backusii]|uniref:Uncharacterized protein n=1 Tax=Apiosordaria backusii TaxID=314023 RepID=A0AA40BNW0_9PEZI|nr:hypothetical protein B0T21DRAFT_170872 [Apiosordaria backusii]
MYLWVGNGVAWGTANGISVLLFFTIFRHGFARGFAMIKGINQEEGVSRCLGRGTIWIQEGCVAGPLPTHV